MIIAEEDGQLVMYDSLGGARVGRWSTNAHEPDRCYCVDPATMRYMGAKGYVEYRYRGRIWRYGICPQCVGRIAKLYPRHRIVWR